MSQSFGKRGVAKPLAPPVSRKTGRWISRTAATAIVIGTAVLIVAQVAGTSSVPKQDLSAPERFDEPSRVETVVAQTLSNYPVVSPATLCKERYPLDYEMRDTCVRVQNEAKQTANSIRIDDDVKASCTKRYTHDWDMFLTCAKEQMAAKLPDADKPDRPRFDITSMCREKWPTKYEMEEYCIKEQQKARDEADGLLHDSEITVRCTGEWPTDWSMFVYCVKNESNAKRRVRG
jgi:hypothetical protein